MAALLHLRAEVDSRGDGWVDIHAPSSGAVLAGLWVDLQACTPTARGDANPDACSEVTVFGGSRGSAEKAGWMVSAGHAFGHGAFGVCPTGACSPVPADGRLLTTLSVAIPRLERGLRVCVVSGTVYHAAAGSAGAPVLRACAAPLAPATVTGYNASRGARGIAFVKTYKTGSSTLGSMFHRYADAHALDVAVNAKALRWAKALELRLQKGTMAKPTEWCAAATAQFLRVQGLVRAHGRAGEGGQVGRRG